jgi:hypothetical protein
MAKGVKISGLILTCDEAEACVTVLREGAITLASCEIRNATGDGVQTYGECLLESCKVEQCAAYGIAVLSGGVARTKDSTISLNAKTGALSRGNGSQLVLNAGTIIEKNKAHGVGADQGGSVLATKAIVRDNSFIGVNLGDGGSVNMAECVVHGNGMHGIQVCSAG